MKKNYIKPVVDMVQINVSENLLTTSFPYSSEKISSKDQLGVDDALIQDVYNEEKK